MFNEMLAMGAGGEGGAIKVVVTPDTQVGTSSASPTAIPISGLNKIKCVYLVQTNGVGVLSSANYRLVYYDDTDTYIDLAGSSLVHITEIDGTTIKAYWSGAAAVPMKAYVFGN